MLSVSPASIAANPGDANNLNWAFNSTPQAFNFLAAGETLTLTYTVKADDGHGGHTPDRHLSSPAPTTRRTSPLAPATAPPPLAETNAALTTSGTLTVTDADLSDSVTPTVKSVVFSGRSTGGSDNAVLGMLSVSPARSQPIRAMPTT